MPVKVNREELLGCLESCRAGLAQRNIVEQSTCFVFKNGFIYSFNDEVSCKCPSPMENDFSGVVRGEKLMEVLKKMPDESVRVSSDEQFMIIQGKRKKRAVAMEARLDLPIGDVEKPGEWFGLPNDFAEAAELVGSCASKNAKQFNLSCVHIHPKWIEATDDFQICRWRVRTRVKQSTYIKHSNLKEVVQLGVKEFSETPSWMHFRNDKGLVISCRRYLDMSGFPDMSQAVKAEGLKTSLPKGIAEAAESANIFSSENAEYNQIRVDLSSGALKIRGEGASGWSEDEKDVDYTGRPLSFYLSPVVLTDLVKRHSECLVSDYVLKAESGPYTYVTRLTVSQDTPKPDEPKKKKAKPSEEEEEGYEQPKVKVSKNGAAKKKKREEEE